MFWFHVVCNNLTVSANTCQYNNINFDNTCVTKTLRRRRQRRPRRHDIIHQDHLMRERRLENGRVRVKSPRQPRVALCLIGRLKRNGRTWAHNQICAHVKIQITRHFAG